jgi:hypothetical protein
MPFEQISHSRLWEILSDRHVRVVPHSYGEFSISMKITTTFIIYVL